MQTELPPMPAFSRYFTPPEAEALLARLRGPVDNLARAARRARGLADLLRQGAELPEDHRRRAAERLADLEARVREIVEGMASEGVEVKGLDPVLLDFPGMLDGRPVYLCWHEGEPRIAWYHDLHAGFAGRRPIEAPEDPRWTWWH